MRLAERLHRRPWVSAALVLAITAWSTVAMIPLKYDFSFTSLFVGEGPDYDRLRDYLLRFGTDVNFVMVAIESDDLYSAAAMEELRELTARLEQVEGVHEVVGPTTVHDLVGDGGALSTQTVIPEPSPSTAEEWAAIRELATTHPLLGGTVFSEDGRHAAMFVRYGLESGPDRCNDGVDNDAGGGVDCLDVSCRRDTAEGVCLPGTTETSNAACTNGVDDDDDGTLDCADADCADVRACVWVHSAESNRDACANGIDDDADGTVDCADRDCLLAADIPGCDATAGVAAIVEEYDATSQDGAGLRYVLGGIPVVSKEYTRVIQHDMRVYLPMTGLLVALVLLALFRSARGVLLPVFVVGVSILWAMGAMMATGGKLNMINSSMPTLLLVIAIADAVHIVSRYLEESETARDPAEATSRTMRRMAAACLLTSVTSAVGFGSLLSAHLPIIRSFGLYTALGIMLAYTLAMLSLPPILARLPLPTDAERKRAVAGERMARGITRAFTKLAIDHRRIATAIVLAVVVPAAWGATRVEADMQLMEELRPDNPTAVANAQIEEHHDGVLSGAIVFHGEPGQFAEPDALRALEEIGAFAEAWRWEGDRRLVSHAFSVADVVEEAHAEYQGTEDARTIPETRAAVVALLDQVPADDRAAVVSADYSVAHVTFRMYTLGSNAWSDLRTDLQREVDSREAALGASDWHFTGSSTLAQDAMRFMTRDLITSLGIAVVIIMALMSVLFRSIRVGIISMVPNAFPMLVTLGLVGFLGIDIRVSTAVVFSISLGIAVDDTIHLLVRFREELARDGADYDAALATAIDKAGRPVVFTTVMLCIGFATLTLSEFTAVRELGFLGGATLVSALVGDLLVLPLVLGWARPKVA